MTVLRGIDFGSCWDAPGVRGWFGEGYWYHRWAKLLPGFNFNGSTRVAKTTTILPNDGNMPILGKHDFWAPRDYFPKCIEVYFGSGRTFNSIALTGPGLVDLLNTGLLHDEGQGDDEEEEPRMISFMSIRKNTEDRLEDYRAYVKEVKEYLNCSSAPYSQWGQQINLTCPNTGNDVGKLDVDENLRMLDIVGELNVPTVLKINLHAKHADVAQIAKHPVCDGFCQTNAIQFGTLPGIAWDKLYPNGSPLAQFAGGGGFSGRELVPLVGRYIFKALNMGIDKPWNAGGGIRSADDVDQMVGSGHLRRGVDSIFFASAAMVRPWNVRSIIARAKLRLDPH